VVSSNSTYAVSIIAQRYIKVTLCTNQNWLGSLLVLEISSQMFTQGRIFGDQLYSPLTELDKPALCDRVLPRGK
jgi:hypothetical protein